MKLFNAKQHFFSQIIADLTPLKKIINSHGGDLFFVGGSIRNVLINHFHSTDLPIKDFDLMILGLNDSIMREIIQTYPNFKKEQQGHAFGVYIYYSNSVMFELALARKDVQSGVSHKDITVDTNNISLLDDAIRRESRMNSIYMDFEYNIIDPLNGIEDIKEGVIHHNSNAFSEDPLRSLRACRQAGQFNFSISEETLTEIKKTKKQIHTIVPMRIFEEFKKILSSSNKRGLHYLIETDLVFELLNINKELNLDFDDDIEIYQKIYLLTKDFEIEELSSFFTRTQCKKDWIQFVTTFKLHEAVFLDFFNQSFENIQEAFLSIKRSKFNASDFFFLSPELDLISSIFNDFIKIRANTHLSKEELILDLSRKRKDFIIESIKKRKQRG